MMKQSRTAHAAAVLWGILLCACGVRPAASAPATGAAHDAATARTALVTSSPHPSALPPCRAGAISPGYGPRVSSQTGELATLYTLTPDGRASCVLSGYPQVALYSASGARLPFRYRRGGGQYVTSAPPPRVTLAPGHTAYLLVAKYRCDLGWRALPAAIKLALPGPQQTVITHLIDPRRLPALLYCRGGPGDPGQVITVSPIEPTASGTYSTPHN